MVVEPARIARSSRRRPEMERAVGRLAALAALSPGQRELVLKLIDPIEHLPMGREIVREAPADARAGLIVSGWACRQRMLPDGRRQIFDLLLPGDFVGLAPSGVLGESWTVCLTRMEFASAEPLRRRLAEGRGEDDRIRAAFAALARFEQLRVLDQIVRLGRQTAHERVGHLLLELDQRISSLGFAPPGRFTLPLTQEVLADVLGLSVVHVNRVLQQLKREHLIELRGGQARLLNAPLLAEVSDFSSPS